MKKNIKFLTAILMFCATISQLVYAQGTCYDSQGCSDYSNFGYNSTTAATLEYDNYVSGFHSSIVRDIDGTFKVWGHWTKPVGATDSDNGLLTPTPINPGNFPGLTGNVLKAAIGNMSTFVHHILLTDDNKLWIWGGGAYATTHHPVIASTLYTLSSNVGTWSNPRYAIPFQQIDIDLPSGVAAVDVKMMFATYHTLVLTTCSGNVWVLSQEAPMRGAGATATSSTTWYKVQKEDGGDLTGIVTTRGSAQCLFALDSDGNLWTWGNRTYPGTGISYGSRNLARPMSLPSDTGIIKMIGVTGGNYNLYTAGYSFYNGVSYYVLYEDGRLFAMGDNSRRQLGDWTTTYRTSWVQPRYGSVTGPVMNDIKWISPQEHDFSYMFINVINEAKEVYNWGEEGAYALGRNAYSSVNGSSSVNPGTPTQFQAGYSNGGIVAIESGGHTTMILKECEANFGYIGHRIHGSMGDNSTTDETDNTVHFDTAAVQVCGANTAPVVKNLEICPATTADLQNALVSASLPTGTSIEWWSTPDRTPGTQVTDPAHAPAGTYYAFLIPSSGGCTEPVASKVIVSELTGEDAENCTTCNAGTTAPAVTTALTNDCKSANPSTVNLANAHTGTVPTEAELVWYTTSTRDTGTQVSNPTEVGAGTYYAFYYDADNNCYSPASQAVTVTINDCADCTDSGITSVNLNDLFDPSDLPHPDVVIEWWTTPNREAGTKVDDPTNVTVSGTYYAFFYDTVNNCYNVDNSTAAVVVNILPPCEDCGERIFIEDFGTSDLSINKGRKESQYMPSGAFTFGTPYPDSNISNETAIDNNHYAVVAPGYIKSGWKPGDLGWYFWTPAYNETSTVTDMSETEEGAVMVVNAGGTLAPFYRREITLEYDTYYHAAFSIFVKNQPARVGIKVGNSASDQVYGMMFSKEFTSADTGKWIDVELSFKVPANADVDCDMENVYLEFFNAKSENTGNDYYIDNIFLEKLDVTGTCPTPEDYITLVCPSNGGSGDCTKEPATGTPNGYTKVGITVQKKQTAWPENIPNGWIALESKEKGFVVTRVTHVGGGTDGAPSSTDAIADPKEGMIVYDIADECIKLFNGEVWSCLNQECGSAGFTLLCNSFAVTGGEILHSGNWGSTSGILPYANGDGSAFTSLSVPSEGVTGLNAQISLPSGSTLTEGSGSYFNVTISGSASGSGIATFPVNINGSNCSIQIEVMP